MIQKLMKEEWNSGIFLTSGPPTDLRFRRNDRVSVMSPYTPRLEEKNQTTKSIADSTSA